MTSSPSNGCGVGPPGVCLEDVLTTEELIRRLSRPSDFEAENRALVVLEAILKRVEKAFKSGPGGGEAAGPTRRGSIRKALPPATTLLTHSLSRTSPPYRCPACGDN